eukprot:tig00000178_g12803.t1
MARSLPIERDPPPSRAVADALRRLPPPGPRAPRTASGRRAYCTSRAARRHARAQGDPVQLGRAGNTASTLTKLRPADMFLVVYAGADARLMALPAAQVTIDTLCRLLACVKTAAPVSRPPRAIRILHDVTGCRAAGMGSERGGERLAIAPAAAQNETLRAGSRMNAAAIDAPDQMRNKRLSNARARAETAEAAQRARGPQLLGRPGPCITART